MSPLLPRAPAADSSEAERQAAERQIESHRLEIQKFFDLYGFVVFSNVLDAEECAATEAEIWVRAVAESTVRMLLLSMLTWFTHPRISFR